MLAYITVGARIILASDLAEALQSMKDPPPSALALRPDSAKRLLETSSPSLQKLATSLRYVETGSAPLEEAMFESLRRLLPKTLIHPSCNLTQAQAAFLEASPDGSFNRIGGLPPTLSLTIVDELRREVPPGQSGRILIKGPGLMKGLWGQSNHQNALLAQAGYCTGDKGTADERGEVTLLGRAHLQPALPKSADERVSLQTLKAAAQFAARGESGRAKSETRQLLVQQA
jgi:acyl-CoA synthetase (AMP-forming)/AMP-acid ligase II